MNYFLTALMLVIFIFHHPCYCEGKRFDAHDESLSLIYIGFGSKSLKLHNFSSALDDFQKAAALLDNIKDHPPELDILILFGKVIAYDNHGLKDECLTCLAKLKSMINSENKTENPELFYDHKNFSLDEYQDTIEITSDLYHLASLSFSKEVKKELFLIVNEMSENVQDKLYTGKNLIQSKEQVKLCKETLIQKIEKIARRVYKAFKRVKEVWEFIKEIDEGFNSKNTDGKEC